MIINTKIIEIKEDKSEETKQTQIIDEESPSQLNFSFQNDTLDLEKFRDTYLSLDYKFFSQGIILLILI